MQVLGIAFVRALRRLGIETQRRVIQLLESDLAGIKTGDGKFTHQCEELSAIFFARTCFVFETERFEQQMLLLW